MKLSKLFRPKPFAPSRDPLALSPTGLLTARDQVIKNIASDQDEASMVLAICSIRSYVFQSILNRRVTDADAISAALVDVDMPIPLGKLRLATLQPEFPGRNTFPTLFEKLSITVNELANCFNVQRYVEGAPSILAHLTDGQSDEVVLLPPLVEGVAEEYYVNYLLRVNTQLQERYGWRFTACISEEFDDLSQLASVYFHTRHIHEQLVDAKAEHAVWLAEVEQHRWDAKPNSNEPVWWVEPMRQYVMQHYANPDMNIAYLSREFGISSAYVGRKFRDITGIGLLELIHRCRLTELERRISAGESLKDATNAVGYTSLLTMQRARERYSHE